MWDSVKSVLASALGSRKFLVFAAAMLTMAGSYFADAITWREFLASVLGAAGVWMTSQGLADVGKSAKLLEYESE